MLLVAAQLLFVVVVARNSAIPPDAGAAAAIAAAGLVGLAITARLVVAGRPWVNRAIDLVVATVVLVVTAPLGLAVAVAIRVVDGGPVLFRHRRCGRGGRAVRRWSSSARCGPSDAAGPSRRRPPHAARAVPPLTSLDELPTWNVSAAT